MSRPQEKVSAQVSNLSKCEMCSNYSLSICHYVSVIIHHPAREAGSAGTALPDLQLRQRFLALMAGAPGSPAPAPPGGPQSMFLSVDSGRSRISISDTSWGPAVDVS
jgi:hypothetical protein